MGADTPWTERVLGTPASIPASGVPGPASTPASAGSAAASVPTSSGAVQASVAPSACSHRDLQLAALCTRTLQARRRPRPWGDTRSVGRRDGRAIASLVTSHRSDRSVSHGEPVECHRVPVARHGRENATAFCERPLQSFAQPHTIAAMGEGGSDRPTMPAPMPEGTVRRPGERDRDATRPEIALPDRRLGSMEPRRRQSQPLVEIPPPPTDDPRRR